MPKMLDTSLALKVMNSNGFIPISKYPGSNKPWKSKCKKCKKITSPTYWNVSRGVGCKYCSNRAVDPKDAVASMKKRGFKTLKPFPGATKPWAVECLKCNKRFNTLFHSLNTTNKCKYCSGVSLDQSDVNKYLKELRLEPLEKFPGAKVPWKMRCLRCNRVVTPSWTHLTRKDRNVGGCVFCSKRRVHMDDMLELLWQKKLKPIGHFINGKTPWLCQCLKCKRQVFPRMNGLRQGQSGCIYCSGLKVEEKVAIKIANKNGFTPLVPYPGAKKGWECLCNICGQISNPHYTSMQQGVNRCKYCATGGFNFTSPAIVYLITNKKLGAHKIGIAGATKHNERLDKHKRQGWTVYKYKKFKVGATAFETETRVLKWLRYRENLLPFLSIEDMPQAGWSETVDASEIDLATIWAKVEQLSRVRQ